MEIPRTSPRNFTHVTEKLAFLVEASVEGNISNEVCNDSIDDDDDHEALFQVENNDEGNTS